MVPFFYNERKAKIGDRFLGLLFKVFFALFCTTLVLFLCLAAPLLIGRWLGHVWGLLMAIGDFLAWISVGVKWAKAPSTRLVWFGGLVMITLMAIGEFQQMSSPVESAGKNLPAQHGK